MTDPAAPPFWVHVAAALRAHVTRLGPGRVPASVLRLVEVAEIAATGRLEPSQEAAGRLYLDDVHMRLMLTLDEVADLTSFSLRQVERFVADGTLRSVKVGGSRRIRRHDLDAWIDDLD